MMSEATVGTAVVPDAEVFAFGDKRIETSAFDRYKGRKNESDRLGFLSTGLKKTYTHYYQPAGEKMGKTFKCLSRPGQLGICCQKLGAADQKFGLVVFKYSTNEDGSLLDVAKCSGKVLIWVISEARYSELDAINKEWPLLDGGQAAPQHDLILKCSEEQYQRMTFTPQKTAHWKTREAWYKALKDKSVLASTAMVKAMGRTLTEEEVNSLLGVAVSGRPTGSTENAGDIDLGDVLDH